MIYVKIMALQNGEPYFKSNFSRLDRYMILGGDEALAAQVEAYKAQNKPLRIYPVEVQIIHSQELCLAHDDFHKGNAFIIVDP